MIDPGVIATLKRLLAAATPGWWQPMRDGNQYIDNGNKLVGASRIDAIPRAWNPYALAPDNRNITRLTDADADFICAIHEHLGLLLESYEELQGLTSPAALQQFKMMLTREPDYRDLLEQHNVLQTKHSAMVKRIETFIAERASFAKKRQKQVKARSNGYVDGFTIQLENDAIDAGSLTETLSKLIKDQP